MTASAKAPAKRRTVRAATAKSRAVATKKAERFTVAHARDGEFKTNGLRSYARYRDLGIAAASGGLYPAHVIHLIGSCTDEVRKRHYHDTELQLIYALKGWMKNEFEGHGEQLTEAGSCWLQPPNIEHTVLDYSDDCEVLDIIMPADFKTVALTKWADFPASLKIACNFHWSVEDASRPSADAVRLLLRMPVSWPTLTVVPLPVRPDAFIKAVAMDVQRHGVQALSVPTSSSVSVRLHSALSDPASR